MPTTINISGWNFTDPAGDVSVDGTYTQSSSNAVLQQYYADRDSTMLVDKITGEILYVEQGAEYVSISISNGIPTGGEYYDGPNKGAALTANCWPNWILTDENGNYILSGNGYYSAPSPLTQGPTIEEKAAELCVGLESQNGVWIPIR